MVKRGHRCTGPSIRRRSAAWTILRDWTFRSRTPASALWMPRARSGARCGAGGGADLSRHGRRASPLRKSKSVGAVFGLTCSRDQSGERDRPGAISRCGDEMMRVMLYEAAQSMLRSNRWSWLKAWAMQVARRQSVFKAAQPPKPKPPPPRPPRPPPPPPPP
jgi:hypothetical protein